LDDADVWDTVPVRETPRRTPNYVINANFNAS
jgi:hypothetical protein